MVAALAASLLAFNGCNLDYPPTAAVSDSSLTDADYQALLNGVYDGAQNYRLVMEDIAADNLNSKSWYVDMDDNNPTNKQLQHQRPLATALRRRAAV